MLLHKMLSKHYIKRKWTLSRRFMVTKSSESFIRNIGILAHIDAGKTTTTERMLFYSGKTHSLGEVHHGNTVTDFLKQERERGITICSAAVTFPWDKYRINLLDTPGHIDFTMEVEQSLAAVDGTVVVLDASAGVEAQTITVWHQADHHSLPRIVFANKMDRADADFEGCLTDLKNKLGVLAIPIQWPIMGEKGLTGIIDILNLNELRFDKSKAGQLYEKIPLNDDLLLETIERRNEIIDTLSSYDDELADRIISNNSLDDIDTGLILNALRKSTISRKIVPVLLGSAYRNTGVQPLIDSVVSLLPAPNERNHIYKCFGKDFAGRVFKVTHDKRKGPLSLIRVLNGKLKRNDKVTTSSSPSEIVTKLYEPLADEYREIDEVDCGDVAVCAGLKNTTTGSLLVSSTSSLRSAERELAKKFSSTEVAEIRDADENDDNNKSLVTKSLTLETKIPDAVYFCSIEPPSLSYQLQLERALAQLQREDPSLRVRYDESTLQTVLGGMGELHLDIIKSRILTEYKIDVDLGPLQIAYRETIQSEGRDTFKLKKEIAGSMQEVTIELSLVNTKTEIFNIDKSAEACETLAVIRAPKMQIVKKAVLAGLERGPLLGGEIMNTQVILHTLILGRGVADSFLMSATVHCIKKILSNVGCQLLEPIMRLQIIIPADKSSQVISDLTRRRGEVVEVVPRGHNKVIVVNAPLAELAGYSTTLRKITSGSASMTMEPFIYSTMKPHDQHQAILRAQGLA